MNILLVSATTYEISPTLEYLENHAEKVSFFQFEWNGINIFPFVTGVGSINTAFSLARYNDMPKVDLALNLGVAGSLNKDHKLGVTVEVVKDRFADLGVEESDGTFTDVFDMELIDAQQFPYRDGWIRNKKQKYNLGLPEVTGLTVNKVTGTDDSISKLKSKYSGDVESMEGAAFLFACMTMDVHCHQIRSISNWVEPRNRENWNLDLAIENLNKFTIQFLNQLPKGT